MKAKNKFLELSIKQKVQYIFVFAIVICVLFCFTVFYFFMRTSMTKNAVEKNSNNLSSIEQNFEAVIDNVNNISKIVMVNDVVTTYLKSDYDSPVPSNAARSEVYNILNSFSGKYSVFIFRSDGSYTNTGIGIISANNDVIFGDGWYDRVKAKEGGYVLIPNSSGAFSSNTDGDVVSFARIINDINSQKPIGLLVINIPVSEFEKTYMNLSNKDNHFAYLDKSGNVICSDTDFEITTTETGYVIENQKDGFFSEKVVTSVQKTDSGLRIVCSSNVRIMEGMTAEIFFSLLIVLTITIIILMLISAYINKYITFPISKLVASMQQVETGMLHRVSLPASNDEIGKLRDNYNLMLIQINKLIDEVIEQEQSRQKAEIEALQAQIKPHFLYNTLDTIGYMSLQNSREEVYDAIETLGNFYRKFLSKGSQTIRLSDEVGIIKDYIKLQRLRYDNLFDDEYEIEEGIGNVMIPKLILQPLVENSIYHGIRPKGEHGTISIKAFSESKMLHIIVHDDGVGMSKEKAFRLIKNAEETDSFGFKGTIDRIRSFYGTEDVVRIDSAEGEFCEIELIVPLDI